MGRVLHQVEQTKASDQALEIYGYSETVPFEGVFIFLSYSPYVPVHREGSDQDREESL